MARAVEPIVTLTLDCEGFSRVVQGDHDTLAFVRGIGRKGGRVVCSAATLIESHHKKLKKASFDYARSRVVVVPVTEEVATVARNLLDAAGLHGHQHAIDAMVAATALAQPGARLMLTSDPSDMSKLCDGQVKIISVS